MSDRFLPTSLRRALERTIKEARAVAEEAAADAIRRLGVADGKPPTYLGEAEQELRRCLRAHGRALGDRKATDDTQTIDRLIEAAAYEHWHRRLFARFLAERHLLRHPEHNVLVTLEDCKEFAAEEGLADEWAAAEAYASRMLPAVFRPEDPVLELKFSPEHELKLRQLVLGIDAETFETDDALGWTYQFWRALEKDRVNKAGGKIGAAELPAVTQLFTEPYMVRFLLHNTLGAWWAGKVLAAQPELATDAPDEATLRAAVRLPGYDLDMLRFVKDGEDAPRWRPAAGTYPGWPAEAKALTVLDPCCGSGHFLTEAVALLSALRAHEEGSSGSQAVAAVLRDNLYGLELDGRCVQIAAFAVALAAWKIGGFQDLPPPHVAWVGAPPPLPKADFLALANGDESLRHGLEVLHALFSQAPTLGSLLNPDTGDFGDAHGSLDFAPMLDKLLAKAKRAEDVETKEGVIAARGMADAAAILRGRYDLIITNVPFLGRGKQAELLANHIGVAERDAKADLATAMLSRALRLTRNGGCLAAVTPQNWLFLSGYRDLRKRVLRDYHFVAAARLGSGAFETVSGEVVQVALSIIANEEARPYEKFLALDVAAAPGSSEPKPSQKASRLVSDSPIQLSIVDIGRQPGATFTFQPVSSSEFLLGVADSYVGLQTGDAPRWLQRFWEQARVRDSHWQLFQMAPDRRAPVSGCSAVVRWGQDGAELRSSRSARIQGLEARGKAGVLLQRMADLIPSRYFGGLFDTNAAAIVPKDERHLEKVIRCCLDERYPMAVRDRAPGLSITNKSLIAVPVLAGSAPTAEWINPPTSGDPTQWLFHGHPAAADAGTQLHVALSRLAGFRWPAELDPQIPISDEARAWISKTQALPSPDADGLLTLPAAGGDRSLADRLRDFLAACFAGVWSEALERQLVAEADALIDKRAARDASLEAWLCDRAFRQHCKLFHDRPFLWQVWDGQKDGFSAFLHYHRLDHGALQKLTYTVLGDWIARRKAEGDDRRVEAASILQSKLAAILEGEAPYDIFVRWKSLARQPLGWDPDLDDGVRLNIRPWVQTGILRENPRINWGTDRGTEPTSAPWYDLFHGKRNNDHHTTLAEKRAARAAKSATAA